MNRKRRFGLDGATAVPEYHLIHGPNTRDARDNIALLAFHTFLVEVHPNEAKIESGTNKITAAHAFVIVTLRLGLRAPMGRPQKHVPWDNEKCC